ncbi:MAG: PAS domain S-box protein [FCB group bacterium]|nr:PAS domain S-box protein [FCB group bacterium]
MAPESDLARGIELLQYSILEKIETGVYCDKYLAEDMKRSRQLMLTILQTSHASSKVIKDHFCQKARAAMTIYHPGFARVLDMAEYQNRPFLVQEKIKGISLREMTRTCELTLTQILDLGVKLGEALRALHKADIVHENLRPEQILIGKNNAVSISACAWAGVQSETISNAGPDLIDCLGYLSPEQVGCAAVDRRTDIFSMGIIIYEMLTCRHPFRKADSASTLRAVVEASPDPPSFHAVDLPDELESIVARAMAKNLDRRYQHINEFLTDLKAIRADETMREGEELYRKLIERIHDGICIIQESRFKFASRHLGEMIGRPAEELIGREFSEYIFKRDLETVKNNYARHMAGQDSPILYESGILHKDGRRVSVEISAGRIMYEGRPAILASIRNISERREAEEAAQASEAKHQELFENILEGAYQTLPDGTILSANPALVQMLGYNSVDELYNSVNARDIYVDTVDRKVLTDKLEKDGQLLNAEFRLKRKDGRIINVLENARAIVDENGDIRHYEGLLTDITERKEAEEQLQRLSAVVKQSLEGIALVDLEGKVIFINAAFANMHGYTPEELQGKNLSLFHTKEQIPSVIAANKQIQETGSFSGEIWHVHRDGTEFPTLMHNSVLYGEDGKPSGMIGTVRDITDLKKAEAALQQSQAMLQSIFKSAPIGIGLVKSRILTWTNEKLSDMIGYSVEEMTGQSARMLYIDENEFDRVGQVKYALIKEQGTGSIKTQWRKKDGTVIDVLLSSTPIDPDDFSIGVTFTALDITERKAAEKMILAQHALALKLGAAVGLDETLRICLEATIRNSGMDSGGIYLVDEISGNLDIAIAKGLSDEFIDEVSLFEVDSRTTRLVMAGKPIYIDYKDLDTDKNEKKVREGIRLIAILPVLHENKVIACMNIASHSIEEVSTTTRQVLETTAAQIGGFVARKLAEKALQASEANYRAIFNSANDAIFVHDIETGKILDVNQQMCEMYGVTYEEARTMTVGDLSENEPPFTQEDAIECIMKASHGEPQHFEWKAKDKKGRVFWVEVNLKRARIGNIDRLLAMVRDITERKRAEEVLRDNEEKWRSLVENTDDIILVIDKDGVILDLNKSYVGAIDEIIGRYLFEFMPSELRKTIKDAIDEVFASGKATTIQTYVDIPGKGLSYFINKIVPMKSEGQTLNVIWLSTDITERKLSEKELQNAHEQLSATLDALPDLLFEVDRNGRILDYRAPDPSLLYTSPDQFMGKRMEQILPLDVNEAIMAAIWEAGDTGHSSEAAYSLEIDGRILWFEITVAVKGDPKAPDVHFIILVRNVTERRENEEKLRETSKQLSAESKALMEKNIALEQVFDHIERQKRTYQQQVLDDIDKSIMPLIKTLKQKVDPQYAGEMEALELNLNAVLTKDSDEFESRYTKLTSRESEICEMIKEGMSTKQIAETLVLSQLTVQKHREQVRKKLGITNTNINLATYLRTR